MKGAFDFSWGAIWRPVETSIEFLFGEAVRIVLEADRDVVKPVSQVSPFLCVAEEKGLGVATGHPACRGEQGPRPDVVAIEDLVTGGLQIAAIETDGGMRRVW